MGALAAAWLPDRHRRDGADGGDHALVSVRSRQARRCRPRFSRRRRRQHPGRPVRRVSRQCQSAADRHRVRDRRTFATVRAVRRGNRARAAGVRRHAAAARPECGARRRAAVRGAADHSLKPDRRGYIASRSASSSWSSPLQRRSSCCRSSKASPSASRSRCCTASGARRGRGSSNSSACRTPRSGGRPIRTCRASAIRVAVVGLQAPLSFLNAENFRADVLEVVKTRRQTAAAGAGSQRHPGDRLHRGADPARADPANAESDGVTVAMARLESTRAQDAFERFGIYDVLPKGPHLLQRRRSRPQAGQRPCHGEHASLNLLLYS